MSSQPLGTKYLLDEPIGRGGMGVVWRGHDRTTGAVYAIKVLQPEYAHDPAAVGRFVRERTALIAFRHPNAVTVHDMIVEGDQLALVMDLVPGGDVDELRTARGGRLAAAEAAALAAQIGDGLAAAHAAGIVHRDVKPANALLHGDRVLLADFGIALLAGHPRVTTEGNVLGTAAYLAPEVIAGQEPGPAGDVYALGVTLYELLSGQPPFTGNTAAILHSHGTVAPARVSGIADGLWNVTAACLAKDPRARPPAAHAAAALRALAAAPDNAVTAPQSPEWRPGPQLWPDPLQAVRTTAVTPAERPPLAGEAGRRTAPRRTRPRRTGPRWSAPRWAAAGRRRTVVIAASVAAVALLATGAVALNAFGSGTSSQQQAQLAGAGWQASQSASAVAAHSHASARPGSSRASGSASATGQPGSSPTPSGAKSGGKAKGSPSASSSARPTGSSRSTGSTGPGSSPSPSSTPSPSSSPSPSSTAVTDDGGLPILYASSGDQAHKCAIIGSAYDANSGVGTTVEGIVCADVLTATESGGYTARAQLEVYCQTTGGADVQCADAIAVGELANEPNGVVASTGAYQCGHSYGPCATGRNYIETGTYSYSGVSMSSCSSDTRTATDSWGLAVGGGSTKIELPGSDDWVSLTSSNADDGSNQSTGHNYICP